MNKKPAVVLVSGGLDSTTVLAIAKKSDFDLFALSFDYGQKNQFELESAKKVTKQFNVIEHKVLKLDLHSLGGSSLTTSLEVEKNRPIAEIGTNIPSTYVPARNTIFLSYALAWADVLSSTNIFIGVNALDYSGYPDCRPEYVSAFEKMANLALRITTEGRKKLKIHTPLINLNKAQIIQKGIELDVDYSVTMSCYQPNAEGVSCGSCDSCILRKKAFKEAGILDPLVYQVSV